MGRPGNMTLQLDMAILYIFEKQSNVYQYIIPNVFFGVLFKVYKQ